MNTFMNGLTNATNFTYTENGALTHRTTKSDLLDMFAMGGAYRSRSDEDVILLFKNAYAENPVYALKCLFYLRDVRGGQGERRFFRVCLKWAAKNHTDAIRRNLRHIPEFGRWDDLYVFVGTPLENEAFAFIKEQLALDVQCKTPSLLAKWLKSENTSSKESRILGAKTRATLGMNHKQYRKTLSILRERINILERLMSENRWDEIEFDKIPSRAGMIYRNAFARHDLERMKSDKQVQTYADFAKDETKTVNAKVLYPYECVKEALSSAVYRDDTQRAIVNKYWDNLENYFNGASLSALCVVDTSGSMFWGAGSVLPAHVAISLGMYCAEKNKGPFAGHFMTFSDRPAMVRFNGIDFVDKCRRMQNVDWAGSTNIEAAFDLMLNTAIANRCPAEDLPKNLIIISDMEFNGCVTSNTGYRYGGLPETLFESMARKWRNAGYEMPHLIFWNVNARQNNIPMLGNGNVSFVSGFSPVIFETVMSGKTGYDLMMEKLASTRYECIQ